MDSSILAFGAVATAGTLDLVLSMNALLCAWWGIVVGVATDATVVAGMVDGVAVTGVAEFAGTALGTAADNAGVGSGSTGGLAAASVTRIE